MLDTQEQKIYEKIQMLQVGSPAPKRWRQLKHLFGLAPSRGMQKIFGGGEVLSDERKTPHDGRNIVMLFLWTVISGKFTLL